MPEPSWFCALAHFVARLSQRIGHGNFLVAETLEHLVQIVAQFALLLREALGAAVLRIARALPFAEGFVEQRALSARQIAEALDRVAERLVAGRVAFAALPPCAICMFSIRLCIIASSRCA
jgi:hypothetical protein